MSSAPIGTLKRVLIGPEYSVNKVLKDYGIWVRDIVPKKCRAL